MKQSTHCILQHNLINTKVLPSGLSCATLPIITNEVCLFCAGESKPFRVGISISAKKLLF